MNVADLAESEVRALRDSARNEAGLFRRALGRLGMGLLFLLVGVVLAAVGLGMLGFAMLMWLETSVDRPAALAIMGATGLAGAGVCLWIFARVTSR